jgi:hypothetical protein
MEKIDFLSKGPLRIICGGFSVSFGGITKGEYNEGFAGIEDAGSPRVHI